MRYVKGHGLQTRSRIVEEASYGLRQRGTDGMSVADLMKLGLLLLAASTRISNRAKRLSSRRLRSRWIERSLIGSIAVKELPLEERFDAFVQGYLSSAPSQRPGPSVVLCRRSALTSPVQVPKARRTFGRKFGEMIDMVAQMLPEMPPEAARQAATSDPPRSRNPPKASA